MKLTIVVPVYKVEAVLERCLTSIVGQMFADFELIIVDDGSPDRSPEMCDEWARRDSRIRVIHQPNGGLSCARNTGIEYAKGEYITFVDSDDLLATDTYEQVMPLMEGNDIVEFPVCWHYGAKNQKKLTFGDKVYTDMQAYWLDGQAYEHTFAWNKIYRRELFADVRFPVGKVFEDAATLPLLLKKANKVATTTKGCYYYCANPNGITAKATGEHLQMLLESHLKMICHTCDARYYMHVLNIQMDVSELMKTDPQLPYRSISPFSSKLSLKLRLKAIALNMLGIKRLCKLNHTIHKIQGSR